MPKPWPPRAYRCISAGFFASSDLAYQDGRQILDGPSGVSYCFVRRSGRLHDVCLRGVTGAMRWKGRRQSANVQDRRRMSPRGTAVGGVGLLLFAVVALFLGANPATILSLLGDGGELGAFTSPNTLPSGVEDELAEMVSVVLADTEDVWHELFRQAGARYEEPTLVLFSGQVQSACGRAGASMGPFYCPADQQVYIDLSFYDDMRRQFGAPGDFAQAYVIAHEVGHHVQNLLGTADRVHRARGRVSEAEYNQLSVRLELQADFYAGVWAHHAQRMKNILESGDIEEALNAASAIGDDRLQRQAQGYVVPESFTHGTSEQRARWFRKGFETGDINQGDTFNATAL
jgi:uncharacterized protein